MKVNEVLIKKLNEIAAILGTESNAKIILDDVEAVDGIAKFMNQVLATSILPCVDKVFDASSDELSELRDSVSVLRAYFSALTNAFSYPKCVSRCLKTPEFLKSLLPLWLTPRNSELYITSLQALHNLSTGSEIRKELIKSHQTIMKEACSVIQNSDNNQVTEQILKFLGNMTACREARRLMLDPSDYMMLEEIFKCLGTENTLATRKSVSVIIKHLTADVVSHKYLLGDSVNILPHVLLPLAGNETFDDDEYALMPPELQYLGQDKVREADMEIRQNLLATLLQLCRLRVCREQIRNCKTYLILRELHKNETENEMLTLIEDVVDLLIRTEEELGEKDFVDFEIPALEDWINGTWEYPDEEENSKISHKK